MHYRTCALLAAASGLAHATDDGVAFDLQRVTISAPALGTLSSQALLTSVDRLSGDALQGAAVGHAYELLGRMPGVMVTEFGQGTTSGKPSFRAFNGEGEVNAVKLLIDGVPSNSNDGNMPYLDLLFPLQIASLSTVRGTNDARFGLHAIAGSIDLATRQGGNATEVRLGAGPWGQGDVQLALDREGGGWAFNGFAGVRHADGWRDHAAIDRSSLSGQLAWQPEGRDLRAWVVLRGHQARAQEPGYLTEAQAAADPRQSPAFAASDGGERLLGQLAVGLEGGQRSALAWRLLAWANRLDDQRWVRFSEAVSQQERDTDELHRGLRALLSWRATPALALEGGLDTERQHNRSLRWSTAERVRVAPTREQDWTFDATGAFVQAVWQTSPDWKIVPGWRVDRIGGHFRDALVPREAEVNGYGSIQQPKLSAVWTPLPGWSAYANWGRSFQVGVGAASFKIPPRTADLRPSINDGTELGLKWQRGGVEGRVALWQQKASDEVYRDLNDPDGDSTNIGSTRRRGLDLQARADLGAGLDAWAALGLQVARIVTPNPAAPDTAGKEVDHVPRRLYSAGLDWQATPAWRFSAGLQGQGDYWLERTNSLTGRYGGFTSVLLGAAWQPVAAWRVDVQLKNAFDGRREYVWFDGTQTLHAPAAPRSLNVALQASY